MRPDGCEAELLRRLASMPFLDRLEMAAVSGRSRGAVYEAVERMERDGLVASIPHSAPLIPPTRRYCLTVAGLHRLARDAGTTVDELLLRCPVSEQGRRVLLERLDALAVVYRLASAVSNAAFPIRFRWYRAMPMDAAITLPDGRAAQRRPDAHVRRDQAQVRSQDCRRIAVPHVPRPGEPGGLRGGGKPLLARSVGVRAPRP